MTEYDDLFKDDNKNDLDKSPAPKDSNDWVSHSINQQIINRNLILIYVIVLMVVSIFSFLFFAVKYPDTKIILDNITLVSEPEYIVTEIPDQGLNSIPYLTEVTVVMKNENQFTLPYLWATIDFYDGNETLIGSISDETEDVIENEIWTFTGEFASNDIPISYELSYGFDELPLFYILINLSQVFITGIIFLVIDKTNFKKDWTNFKLNLKKYTLQIVVGILIVYTVSISSQYLLEFLGQASTSENEVMIGSMFSTDILNLVLLFLLLCVFTPIVEELVFRKVLFNFVEKRFGSILAIISSGVIFGLMHVISYGDFIQAIPYVGMGIVFGYIYFRANKNIYVPIAVHFINNFISYSLYVLMVFGFLNL
ncbi:MAG: CPBP family intramembrane metalloprotease [Firmicutes bacterium]|nr:CPBP family intramembrane metalloprotease [Bacillota bacterium]